MLFFVVVVVAVFSFVNILWRPSPPRNQMKDFLREAIVEDITTMFCPLITIEGARGCV